MLGFYPFIAFVATHNPDLAKAFYGGTLGLPLIREEEDALVFQAHGTTLRVTIVQDLVAAKYSVLGWEVPDIVAEVTELRKAGVKFVKLEVSRQQDELGIWTSPKGDRVAWFNDPDDNVLSIKQSNSASLESKRRP
jgi:catechol 2,3-dioxygenase-like lactoylglutathione lyase family enzyme